MTPMHLAKCAGLSVGHLKISVVTMAKYLIPSWLGEYCRQYPNIEPEFQIGNRADIIQDERLLMREQGSGTRYAIERFCYLHNLHMPSPVTIASNEAIKESVMAGLGISIISRHALNHMAPGNLIELAVEHFPIPNSWY